MAEFSSPPGEVQRGIRSGESRYGRDVLLAVDPKTICMIDGPGTRVCLNGRCEEIIEAQVLDANGKLRQPEKIAPIDFYVDGSDERTEECRRQLAIYQTLHR